MDDIQEDISEEDYGEDEETSSDDDELSPEEGGFLQGHDEANDLGEDKGGEEDENKEEE